MLDLTGKKALVTGATQGIGLSIAKHLSENGAKVFMNGTNEEKAIRAAEQIAGAQTAVYDLSLPDGRPKVEEKYLKALRTLPLEEVWKPIFLKEYDFAIQGDPNDTQSAL